MQLSGMPVGTFPKLPKDLTTNYYALKPYVVEFDRNKVKSFAATTAGVCAVLLLAGAVLLCLAMRWRRRRREEEKKKMRELQVCSLPLGVPTHKIFRSFIGSLSRMKELQNRWMCD